MNEGIMIDGLLPFGSNISNISCSAFFHLLDFVLHFPQHSNEVLIHALVTSRIAYCNSLLVGIPEKRFHRLQLIQNSAARIVTNSRTFDHISPILVQLQFFFYFLHIKLFIIWHLIIFQIFSICILLCALWDHLLQTYYLFQSSRWVPSVVGLLVV